MIIESIAIIVLIVILIFMIARTGRQSAALCLLPLLCVPLFYMVGIPVSGLLANTLQGLGRPVSLISITVLGLVVGCALFGMLCGNFRTRRAKQGYLVMCCGFSAALAMVLIHNIILVLLPAVG